MFRENVLVKEDIIGLISESMVPVALDYQKVLDLQSRESRFVRSMITLGGDIQGVRVISPEGTVLESFSGFGDMAGKTRHMIQDALEKFGPLEKRRVSQGTLDPERGIGFRSGAKGSVCLAVYVRRRDQDKIKSPVISNIILTGAEMAEFAPAKMIVGETWLVPVAVAKKLCRAASPMCYQHAPQPGWVKSIALVARVLQVKDGRAKLAYEGTLSSERIWRGGEVLSEQKLTLRGEGVYDVNGNQFQSLLLVGSGAFRWPEEAPDKRVPFDALIEWESAPEAETGPGLGRQAQWRL